MDMERKAQLVNRVSNLSDSSTVTEWKGIAQLFGDMYKEEMLEVLTGATSPTLAAERAAADVDIASLVAEFDQRTDSVLK
jgi:hypothetical protein